MLKQSSSTRSHPNGEMKTLINSVRKKLVGDAVQVECGTHRWCSKAAELKQNEKENEQNWKHRKDMVSELGVERQDGSKIVLHSLFLLCSHQTYIIPSETEFEKMFKELMVKQSRVEPRLSAYSNENGQQKAAEAVASSLVLRNNVKEIFFEYCKYA